MHCRNVHQVLGVNLYELRPSVFCLYYAHSEDNDYEESDQGWDSRPLSVNLAKSQVRRDNAECRTLTDDA
ncbi:TalC [Salmonella phage 19]|nr:TalC [Salmonella phage 19]